MEGKLVIISAPSGAGKTTIVRHLLSGNLRLEFSISATTRRLRGNETDGADYFFHTVEEFKNRIKNGDFVEWQEVYKDHFYGTLRDELNRIWEIGHHVLFDVDVEGGINLKKQFGSQAIAIFIMPPSIEELEKRLVNRGTDCPSTINMRIEKARKELKQASRFDAIIINDDLEQAKDETIKLVSAFLNSK